MSKLEIWRKDLRRETFHCGGPGGQNVNKVETGVRWTYLPLNLSAKSCEARTQKQNERIALIILLGKIQLYYQKEEIRKKIGAFGYKIRSYISDGQKRVVDHRFDKVYYNLSEIMDGNIDQLLQDHLNDRLCQKD